MLEDPDFLCKTVQIIFMQNTATLCSINCRENL